MIKTYKVMLCPNNKQRTKLFLNANAARYAYNWAVATENKNHKQGKPFIPEDKLRKMFTEFKKTDAYRKEFNRASNDAMKQGLRDAVKAFKKFFAHKAGYPKFKSTRNTKPSFYQDTHVIQFTETHVRIQNISDSKRHNRNVINWIRLAEHGRIPTNAKYLNPRITFDGLNWWVSVSIKIPDTQTQNNPNDGIGIDLGIKDLAILSDKTVYKNLNKSAYMKKLKRRERRLQRSVSRKYKVNNLELIKLNNKSKKGKRYKKTKNIRKAQKRLLKLSRRIRNILITHIRFAIHETVEKKPKFVVLEDLAVKNMMKNRKLSRAIQVQRFGIFRRLMTEQCQNHGIILIIANRWFPSSKTCCKCGHVKKDLKLSDRTYCCPNCGNQIDRDYQASVNLKKYGDKVFLEIQNAQLTL